FIEVRGKLKFALLHNITSIYESRNIFSGLRLLSRVATCMIPVQMSVDHNIDIIRSNANLLKLIFDSRSVLYRIHFLELRVKLITQPCINKNPLIARFNQQGTNCE